jgi:peptidoglycan L-alanyl-D-glutamate endopeptidase CwlK
MPFKLGIRSRYFLSGCHIDLIRLAERAITLSPIDWRVTEGRRTEARQTQLVAAGASRTMNSRHITGHAIDVAALVGGAVRWELPLYIQIAGAFRDASAETGIPVEWGGCWKAPGADIDGQFAAYVEACRVKNRKPFVDGPHFQLPTRLYPA